MKRIIILFIFILLLLSACWDSAELEEVGFVIGVAFDPNEEDEQTFDTTFHIAIPSAFVVGGVEGGGASGQNEQFFNVSSTGATNLSMIRNVNTRRSRPLNVEHLKVIIVNEELARQSFMAGVLDLYTRDHEMRRKTHVLVSTGSAMELFNYKLPLEEMPGISIEMIDENNHRVLEMIKTREIGTIAEKIIANESYLIPRIHKLGEGDLEISGAALFKGKDNNMIGWLNDKDIQGYNWVLGEASNGIVEATSEEGKKFIFEILTQGTKIKYERVNSENVFTIDIKAEGSFGESWIEDLQINDMNRMDEIEQILTEEIQRQARDVIVKMQTEYFCDIFYLGSKIKRKEYQYWKSIKDDWEGEDGLFREAKININVEVTINHYMTQEKLS